MTQIVFAQNARTAISFNKDWEFVKGDTVRTKTVWQKLMLPHTWNVADVLDDEPGYYRGVGWYKKSFSIDNSLKGKNISFYFEGANQVAEVYINGQKAGAHVGGYTGFSVDATNLIRYNTINEIKVKVNNGFDSSIAPLSADFSFYGGIYRDVYLVTTNTIHFSHLDHGSNGVYITTPLVSKAKATVHLKMQLANDNASPKKVLLHTTLFDARGKKVADVHTARLLSSTITTLEQQLPQISHPQLWSPENPYLYSVRTIITDTKGNCLDSIATPIGFRWFSFNADSGFVLNGSPYKLVGASRHQDYEGLGNAVSDSIAINDVVLLKNMGANFLRVAHYPQDPCILEACDRLGILASVEIPVVNEISESENFFRNCEAMQVEMIRQNYNHTSVILWCYMNEVLLKPHFANDAEKQKIYFSHIYSLARRLDSLTRKEDPFRYTMMADHGSLAKYEKTGLLKIPMVVGWNLYSGWYGGSMEEFPQFLDEFHKLYPNKPFMVTEYGADADPRIRSDNPVRFDKSIEYATRFHQYYVTEMLKRPYVAGAVVWNLADFNSETRNESMPHMNNKGLLCWNRKPKDAYYFYKAILAKEPFVKILGSCEKDFFLADSSGNTCSETIVVASNMDSISLRVNGANQLTLPVVDGLCSWNVTIPGGQNNFTATGYQHGITRADEVTTKVHVQPKMLVNDTSDFATLNIMLGSNRYYKDEGGNWWQPDQSYTTGSWGFIGGKKFKLANNNQLPYGTDKNILNTEDDPVFQTQQTGISAYKLDVLPGRYALTLHFAELMGGRVKLPPYNLNDDERDEKIKHRIFNVMVNGKLILDHFNIADQYGLAKAVSKTLELTVEAGEGITVNFVPIEGEPVLNALQLKKLDEHALNSFSVK